MKTNTDIHTKCRSEQDSDALASSSRSAGIASETPPYPDDSDGLGYRVDEAAGMQIGYVEEINGCGGALAPEFIPTRFELEIIAEHWITRRFDHAAFYFAFGQTGSSEWRESIFADRRLDKLHPLLGEEKYAKIVAAVHAKMEEIHGEEFWRRFRNSLSE